MSTDISAPWPCAVSPLSRKWGSWDVPGNHTARENWSWDSTWVDAPKLQQSWAVTRPL